MDSEPLDTDSGPPIRREILALIRQGKSYGETAAALGLTRSAVGGHVSRARASGVTVELPSRSRKLASEAPPTKGEAKPEPKATPVPVAPPVAVQPPPPPPRHEPAPIAASKPAANPVRGAAQAVAALKNAQCRWPIGDPFAEDFRFCCAPVLTTAGPQPKVRRFYCAEHRRESSGDRNAPRPFVPRRSGAQGEAAHG